MFTARVTDAASSFWLRAATPWSLKPNIHRAALRSLPLAIITMRDLRPSTLTEWGARNGIESLTSLGDRPLHALLIAKSGRGIVFLSAEDDYAEQRFSLAHEIAHFLFDYQLAREKLAQTAGSTILDAVDGNRPVSLEERLAVALSPHTLPALPHLLDRGSFGEVEHSEIAIAEASADALGYELLLPSYIVLRVANELRITQRGDLVFRLSEWIEREAGFPKSAARRYAEEAKTFLTGPDSILDQL